MFCTFIITQIKQLLRHLGTVSHKRNCNEISTIHVINFKEASERFFFHFLEVFEKCIEYIRIFFIISWRFQNFGKR